MKRLAQATGFILAAIVAGRTLGAESLVLNERCYWRQYFVSGMMRLSADVLKNEGEKWLGAKLLQRLERDNKAKYLASQNIDWTKTDWRDVAVAEFVRDIADEALPLVPAVYPPADWMKPEFDDGDWVRQRLAPLPQHRSALFQDCWNRSIYFRSTFEVPDPAKATALTLSLVYRGGVRVFINGTEIARNNLPQGNLAPETPGTDYPEDAYRGYIDELTEPNKGRRCVADLRFPFEQAPKPDARMGSQFANFRLSFYGVWVNKKGWDRIKNLRDRTLGPVNIPGNLLRKGTNVVAVEIRGSHYHPVVIPGAGGERFSAENWAAHGGFGNFSWAHARLITLELTDPAGAVPAATARPQGTQVWVEDMHNRLCLDDYNQAGGPAGKVKIVGALNGTYSAQVAVGTDKELSALKAVPAELKGAGGAIPPSAFTVSYMLPTPLRELGYAGYGRGMGCGPGNDMSRDTCLYFGKSMDQISYLDHISLDAPESVPAGTCTSIWLSLKVPESTAPGKYTGSVTVQAQGMAPVAVPVELEVFGWRVPDPLNFQEEVFLEQSPYGIAKHYKVPLWSSEHFRLIESSVKLLARVGDDVLYIPVIQRSEFGNIEQPTMIKWIRKKDGSLTFDYTALDRYLDIAVKYLGKPAVISFGVMHTMMASSPPTVTIHNEATGKDENVDVSWMNNPFDRIPIWTAFASDLIAHMKARGLGDSVYWGHAGDPESDPGLIALFSELFPNTYWTASPHSRRGGSGGGGHVPEVFRAMSEIYAKPYTKTSYLGWLARQRGEDVHNPLCPRQELSGMSLPYIFRLGPDRAMHLGYTGIGRLGFDYFDKTWLDGYRGEDWNPSGIPCFTIACPGKNAVESSARYETFIEGIQEAELRIFLEEAIHRKAIPDALAAEATAAILDRFTGSLCNKFREAELAVNTVGWQVRSRRVLEIGARVAQLVGLDVDRAEANLEVPALAKTQLAVTIRNWTGKPRAWKAASSAPWLIPAKTEGTTQGDETLLITIDGTAQKDGAKLAGTVTVTDPAGLASNININVRVTAPMSVCFDHPNFNVPVGKSETRQFRIVNDTISEQDWRLSSSVDWIKIEPAAGKLAPGTATFVSLTATPSDRVAVTHDAAFNFVAAGGVVNQQIPSRTFVLPPYKDPGELPFGRIVKIEKVDPKLIKFHKIMARGDKAPTYGGGVLYPQAAPLFGHECRNMQPIIGKKRFDRAMWVTPAHETVYSLEGTGFTTFAAYVGVPVDAAKSVIRHHHRRVNFEIYLDGKIVTQSGLMTTRDEPRLLVVEGLDKAKEMKLVTRLDSDRDNNSFLSVWANAEFYQKR